MAEFFEKWRSGLAKTSKTAFGQLAQLLGATQITHETWEDLETLLVQADLGIETTAEILESLRLIVRGYAVARQARPPPPRGTAAPPEEAPHRHALLSPCAGGAGEGSARANPGRPPALARGRVPPPW